MGSRIHRQQEYNGLSTPPVSQSPPYKPQKDPELTKGSSRIKNKTTTMADWIKFIVLALLPATVQGTLFRYNDDMTCTSPVDIEVESATCDDGDLCHLGDHLHLEGMIDLSWNLPSADLCATETLCWLGLICKTYEQEVNICNALGSTSNNDGTPCPAAGQFYFSSNVPIPGKTDLSLGGGWFVTWNTKFTDCRSSPSFAFQCECSFTAVSSSNVAGAAVGIVVVLGLLYARKRRAAAIDLNSEEAQTEDSTGRFEMMKDPGTVRI